MLRSELGLTPEEEADFSLGEFHFVEEVSYATVHKEKEGGRVVGFASLRGAKLTTLYVDPVAQGAGVGTRLLAEAEGAGARQLEIFEANGHGRHFYEARGWRDAGGSGEWLDRPLSRSVE